MARAAAVGAKRLASALAAWPACPRGPSLLGAIRAVPHRGTGDSVGAAAADRHLTQSLPWRRPFASAAIGTGGPPAPPVSPISAAPAAAAGEPTVSQLSPPAGWALKDAEGCFEAQLHRSAGGEDIRLRIRADAATMFDEFGVHGAVHGGVHGSDTPPGDRLTTAFEVLVAKQGREHSLVLTCEVLITPESESESSESTPRYHASIQSVALRPIMALDEDVLELDGGGSPFAPPLGQLGVGLRTRLDAYLVARGIDSDVLGFLVAFLQEKERRERAAFVGRLESFIA